MPGAKGGTVLFSNLPEQPPSCSCPWLSPWEGLFPGPDLGSDPLCLSLNVSIIFLKLAAGHSLLPALLINTPSFWYFLNPGAYFLSFNFIHNSIPKLHSLVCYPSLLYNHKKNKAVSITLINSWIQSFIQLPSCEYSVLIPTFSVGSWKKERREDTKVKRSPESSRRTCLVTVVTVFVTW